MFVKNSRFKQMMKNAWKGKGLRVAMHDGVIYLSGNIWEMEVECDTITKEILAAIVELTGEIPKEGEVFLSQEGEGNQIEEFFECRVTDEGFTEDIYTSNLVFAQGLGAGARIMQEKESKKLVLVSNAFFGIIDDKQIDRNKETNREGPFYHPDRGFLFKNNKMKLRFGKFERFDEIDTMLRNWEDCGIVMDPNEKEEG